MTYDILPPCPSCGCETFCIHGQARGPVEYYYDKFGKHTETLFDRVWGNLSEIVRCDDCGKSRRDLERIGIAIIKKKDEKEIK